MDSRLRALGPARARRRDELTALAMVVISQAAVWTVPAGGDTLLHGSRAWNAVVLAATSSALGWRRRAPLGAVVAAVAAQCGTHLVAPHGIEFLGFVPMLLLTSSAGWYLRGHRGWVALAVALVGLAAVEISEPTMHQPENLLDALWLVAPWGLLRALRAREERVRRLAGELAALEAAQEAHRREVVAAERARIARDLHDVVAHATSVMMIQIGAARMRHEAGERDIAGQLAAAESTGRQAIAELRRLLEVLRSWPEAPEPSPETPGPRRSGTSSGTRDGMPDAPAPPQPRLDQLDGLVGTYRAAGLRVEVVGTPPADLPLGVQVSAYRIVQEALTNSLRHGGGRCALVRVDADAGDLVVEVSDRGDPSTAVRPVSPAPHGSGDSGGHGLVGISERARLLGGSASSGPNTDGGWTVLARLPRTGQTQLPGVPA
ncbi:sensor histidine kinase [Nocardioides cheoyonin]|uniref:sensor histidine kinase n=1 Tax=Nocardioides cheoyonin TaxID=3156615 RepID=UPI0032B4B36C